MCTVTWVEDHDGLHVFCNRDEMRNREEAQSPELIERNGMKILAPIDGRAGGTWLAVNECGIGVTLLNGPMRGRPVKATPISRGQLVLELASLSSIDDVARKVSSMDLDPYPAFTCLVFALGEAPQEHTWNLDRLDSREIPVLKPFTSSSFKSREVIESRVAHFVNSVHRLPKGERVSAAFLESYHRSHHPSRGAYSVCMHRPDAQTVSFTRLRITPELASMQYEAESPCHLLKPASSQLAQLQLAKR